jgi:hypothetical protein
MHTEDISFHSDRLELTGSFYLPEERAEGAQPLVVACSGFTGLRHIHPARFARSLTERGQTCFSFDYRGFADCEGERGRVLLQEQVRDIVNAVAYAQADPRVDAHRIILLGWGMAGGMVLEAARWLSGVVGVVAANGFYDGARVQRHHRGEEGYEAFVSAVEAKRRQRVRTGEVERTDPFDLYPLDPQSRRYVDEVLRKAPHYDADRYSWELGESLLAWNVEERARSLRAPLLVAHGDGNELHPVAEAESLYEKYAGPKTLYWIEGAGHTEFMHDDDPKFIALATTLGDWIERLLR